MAPPTHPTTWLYIYTHFCQPPSISAGHAVQGHPLVTGQCQTAMARAGLASHARPGRPPQRLRRVAGQGSIHTVDTEQSTSATLAVVRRFLSVGGVGTLCTTADVLCPLSLLSASWLLLAIAEFLHTEREQSWGTRAFSFTVCNVYSHPTPLPTPNPILAPCA